MESPKELSGYVDPLVAVEQKGVGMVKPRHWVHHDVDAGLRNPSDGPRFDAGTPIVATPGFAEPNEGILETKPVKSVGFPDCKDVDESCSEEGGG